ncbi:MAG: crosslink repair DNA glycosylase YcaQ family protein [Solirubrobacteraceae bacterium]|nr:crosslink repair DNA glycosylase YcaQ family protein [Solirubrobacteraceae bacterium]
MNGAVDLTREQALGFRLARHHLIERLSADGAPAAAVVGLQDTPPGTAALALAARADVAPEALDELVIVPSVRGAPLAIAAQDLAVFTAGLDPPDEAAAKVVVGNAWKSLDDITAMEALDRVSAAVADSLRDGPLARDDFHQALRERLPQDLLWWCKGCDSHHVHPSLWRATGIRGVLAIVGREGRSAVFGLPPEAPSLEDPGAELARRFLRAYGPARPKLFADWAGLATAHAAALWERAGELARVDLDGTKRWALAEDRSALTERRRIDGVRLLANLDPLNAGRDRELLVPDGAVRKRIWKVLGGPGTVLVRGEVAALWRPAKKGRKLLVTVEPLGRLSAATRDELAAEAERLAPFRGAETAELRIETR